MKSEGINASAPSGRLARGPSLVTRWMVVLLVAAVMVAAVLATVWLIRVERERQPAPVKDPVATQAAPKPEPGAAPRRDPEVRRRAEIGLSPR